MPTLVNAHYVDCDINGESSAAVTDWDVATPSVQKRAIAHPTNWAHLEGQAVDVLDDGVVVAGSTIASSIVSPVLAAGTNHVGLNFISLLKPSKLDLQGMGLVVTKNITKLIVSFLNTLMGKCGTNNIERPTSQAEMEVVSFGTDLFTGIKEVPVYGGYEREGDLIVKQDQPLPMICRGVVIDLGAHDK